MITNLKKKSRPCNVAQSIRVFKNILFTFLVTLQVADDLVTRARTGNQVDMRKKVVCGFPAGF